ncbi:hypothetical protein TH61_14500 [Rufibacter sp. DG15C]|uniref:DUF4199 domain-containing protein n=1 Tax=Rufibacter sp. DG15C TaxID=1379909 RepID=UPI00078BC284|nr:DUF4199 domain-containing protein [Rufibacter sp. DG15C]AMM52152.1 hypothetical protein TH61_14500 [Rufibacter sp. DG15C]
MEQRRTTVQRTGTYYGFLTGIAAIIYIVLVKLLGLIENVGLHFLIGLILVVGVVMAIKHHKSVKHGHINYLEGIGVGFVVGLVASIIYIIFHVVSNYVFDNAFSYPYMADNTYGVQQGIWIVAFIWLLMGVVIGTFVGYIAMQFFKRPDHKLSDS